MYWTGIAWDTFVPHITCIHPAKLSNHFLFNLPSIETKCVMIVILEAPQAPIFVTLKYLKSNIEYLLKLSKKPRRLLDSPS